MIPWTARKRALAPRARRTRIWLCTLLAATAWAMLGCGSKLTHGQGAAGPAAAASPPPSEYRTEAQPAAFRADAESMDLNAVAEVDMAEHADVTTTTASTGMKAASRAAPSATPRRDSWNDDRAKRKTAESETIRDETSRESASLNDAGTTGPLLIYRADLQIAAFEVDKTLDAIEKKARELGGYLVKRSDQSVLTVRVPSRHFDAALRDVQGLGDVVRRNIQVDDVTDKFFDIEVRLKNSLAMRERLEQLLSKAKNVSESLVVERELARVAGEIERLRGRLRLMSELIAYSTISVQVVQVAPQRTVTVTGFQLPFPWLNELGLRDLMRIQ